MLGPALRAIRANAACICAMLVLRCPAFPRGLSEPKAAACATVDIVTGRAKAGFLRTIKKGSVCCPFWCLAARVEHGASPRHCEVREACLLRRLARCAG